MPLSQDELPLILKGILTADETARCVAYALQMPVPGGTKLEFPRILIHVPWEAFLIFVDRDPMANWSHSCRYILINRESRETQSFEAVLPPFRAGQDSLRWRAVYKAPNVPDAVLAVPQ